MKGDMYTSSEMYLTTRKPLWSPLVVLVLGEVDIWPRLTIVHLPALDLAAGAVLPSQVRFTMVVVVLLVVVLAREPHPHYHHLLLYYTSANYRASISRCSMP